MRTFARPWSPRHTLAVGSLVAAALAAVAVPVSTQSLSPVVTVSGDHFNVAVGGGAAQPKFLLMLSYFGAFRAPGSARTGMTPAQATAHLATIRSHFSIIRGWGFSGVRLFPNWMWSPDKGTNGDNCDATDPNTLMSPSGVNYSQLSWVAQIVDIAAQEGLIVDLSFNMEQVRAIGDVPRLGKTGYKPQMGAIALAGAGAFRNTFFDLENEFNGALTTPVVGPNCPKEQFSDAEIADLKNTVKAYDSLRIVTASQAFGESLYNTAVDAVVNGLDIVAYHDIRNSTWDTRMPAELTTLRNAMAATGFWKPIYYQEPEIAGVAGGNGSYAKLANAYCNARVYGAAAWTMHTEKTFNVASTENGLANAFPGWGPDEQTFINNIAGLTANCAWLHNP